MSLHDNIPTEFVGAGRIQGQRMSVNFGWIDSVELITVNPADHPNRLSELFKTFLAKHDYKWVRYKDTKADRQFQSPCVYMVKLWIKDAQQQAKAVAAKDRTPGGYYNALTTAANNIALTPSYPRCSDFDQVVALLENKERK